MTPTKQSVAGPRRTDGRGCTAAAGSAGLRQHCLDAELEVAQSKAKVTRSREADLHVLEAGSAGLACGWEMQKVGSSRDGEGLGRAAGQPRGKHAVHAHQESAGSREGYRGTNSLCSWEGARVQPPSCSQPHFGTWGCCFSEPWEMGASRRCPAQGCSPAHTCLVVTALWRMGPTALCNTASRDQSTASSHSSKTITPRAKRLQTATQARPPQQGKLQEVSMQPGSPPPAQTGQPRGFQNTDH